MKKAYDMERGDPRLFGLEFIVKRYGSLKLTTNRSSFTVFVTRWKAPVQASDEAPTSKPAH